MIVLVIDFLSAIKVNQAVQFENCRSRLDRILGVKVTKRHMQGLLGFLLPVFLPHNNDYPSNKMQKITCITEVFETVPATHKVLMSTDLIVI